MKRMRRVSRKGTIVWTVIVGLIGVGSALGYVWLQLRAIDYGYKLSQASRLHAQLAEQNRKLRVELGMLKNPARVAEMAQADLGLVSPDPGHVRHIRAVSGSAAAIASSSDRASSGWQADTRTASGHLGHIDGPGLAYRRSTPQPTIGWPRAEAAPRTIIVASQLPR